MDSAWDRLLDRIDHLTAAPEVPLGPDDEQVFADLCSEAMATGDVDHELHVPDVARWLTGLVGAHRTISAAHPEVDADRDLADLRLIVTRWLHPARPR